MPMPHRTARSSRIFFPEKKRSPGAPSRSAQRAAALLLPALLACALALSAQPDTSLLLAPEKLGYRDILSRDIVLQKPRALAATRSEEDLDQLPFTVWTISAADILRFGFVTLGDVLRAAPGIRVSQPGNAVEGEIFLMRGLAGNQHVKVLINDVPITPTGAHGLPIGAQLPIRQAERIEVIYGPNGVLYGNDACAGVVNIVLKETERPVFTQADLSFGNTGFNNLDLSFGGKMGSGRNIFRFSLYGSSTVRERWDVYDEPTLTHNPSRYHLLGLNADIYLNNPNFLPAEPNNLNPKLAPISHESRLFGGNFAWRGIHFTYHRMARFDHSALGLNPFSVSWGNSGNRLNERMETFALGLRNKKKTFHNTLSFIRYRVEGNSSASYLFNRLFLAEYRMRYDSTLPEAQQNVLRSEIFRRYASRERYAVANAFDLRFESRLHTALRTNLYLDAGLQLNLSNGASAIHYYEIPVENIRVGNYYFDTQPFAVPSLAAEDFTSNLYGQLAWRGKHLRLLAGASVFASGAHEYVTVPMRFAGLYRFDSTWSVYANYGTGFRPSNGYENANRFGIYDTGQGYDAFQRNGDRVGRLTSVQTFEAGLRFAGSDLTASGSFFHQNAYHLIRAGYLLRREPVSSNQFWYYGYEAAPGRALTMWGVQGLLSSKGQEVPISRGKRRELVLRGRTEFFFQYSEGKEWFGEPFPAAAEIRNSPRWMAQFRTWTGTDKFELMLASNLQQSVLSKAVTYADFWQRDQTTLIRRYPRFRSWDVMLRLYLSKHLLAYCLVQNVFNRQISGLDATGTPEDLNLPIQQGRTLRFGANYNLGQ
jgi:outer membrane receptor protein involved in Fe transport